MEKLDAYIARDRRQALLERSVIPDRLQGAALFADISGFTPLTEALARELGPQRGAEELTYHINAVYDALIAALYRYSGSVISFAGDAIICWLDGDDGRRAVASAWAMQKTMAHFASVSLASGATLSLAMKAAVAVGPVRRFVIGDPDIQIMDVLAGATLDELTAAEQQAQKGEVVLAPSAVASLQDAVKVVEWRRDGAGEQSFAVVADLSLALEDRPWPDLPDEAFAAEAMRPWLLPVVYERLQSGQGEFLAELRPAVSVFVRFGGIDYDADAHAGSKLDEFVQQVQRILNQYEGTLLDITFGDKGSYMAAAFGAPVAHEDDVARAVSAATMLQTLSSTLDFIEPLQIGIALGRMRTGAYGGTMRRTYGVMGDTVNLAARLMQAAAPNQILASHAVYSASEDNFRWEVLSPIKVKGKTEPVAVATLIRARRQTAGRLYDPQYALPMVGRQEEIKLLRQILAQARRGEGQIVSVTGEAGIGKSRLLAEVIRLSGEHQFERYAAECQSYATASSYFVWQNIWRRFFRLEADAPLEEQVATLEQSLREIDPALLPRLPLLGAVANLSIPDNELTRSFDAKLRKTSLESLLVTCVRARATERPLLFVLEDLHWIDPLSSELLETIARTIADLPVLMLLSYRPARLQQQEELPVTQLLHCATITLAEFTRGEAEHLIRLKLKRFLGEDVTVPQELIANITERAEGNPFYIEEFINYLQDRRIAFHEPLSLGTLDAPTSLHSLILSRFDRLTESQKGTIKVASVIGRVFQAAMLWGAYPQLGKAEQIKRDLEVLNQLDLTPLDTPEPELTYLFKSIITQEVAYENLPYAMRATLHELIGRYIEDHYRESPEQVVNLLAFHYEHSNNEEKQREYLLKAAEAAQANYANQAAIQYYQRALPLLPETERNPIMLQLADVLQLVGRWTEAGALYEEALALAQHLNDWSGRAWSQTAIAEHLRKQGRYDEASTHLARARTHFEALGDRAGVGQILHNAGTLAAQQGNYEQARRLYEESLAIRRELGDEENVGTLLTNMGIVARRQGDYKAAQELYDAGLSIRRRFGEKRAIAVSLTNLGFLALHLGNLEVARERFEESMALVREIGDRWFLANTLNNLANVAREQGDYVAAHNLYEESLRINRSLGDKGAIAFLLEDISSLAAAQQQARRALRLYAAARILREEIGAPLPPADREKLEELLQEAEHWLSEAERAEARAMGETMTLEEAITYALEGDPVPVG